jgi:hypothetical protein
VGDQKMTTYLFITRPEYTPEKVTPSWKGWWSCSSTSRAGDNAFVYVATKGICFEWVIRTDAKPHPEWKFICDVQRKGVFDPPIAIAELRSAFSRGEWPPPYLNFRGFRSLLLPDTISDRIRSLRRNIAQPMSDEEPSAFEGLRTEAVTYKQGRSRALRDDASAKANGTCDACAVDYSALLEGKGVRVLQVHHRKQLAATDRPRLTKLSDLAVVCANCHMLIHMDPKRAFSVEKLRAMLRGTRA